MNWHDAIRNILDSDSIDLVELAKCAGQNPESFYIGIDLSGVDIRNQNLLGVSFLGSNIDSAIFNDDTQIDPIFDPRSEGGYSKFNISVSYGLYQCLKLYEADSNYIYTGWAIKNLIERSFYLLKYRDVREYWLQIYENSAAVRKEMVRGQFKRFSLKVKQSYIDEIYDQFDFIDINRRRLKFSLMVAVLDYWNINPLDFTSETTLQEIFSSVALGNSAHAVFEKQRENWKEYENRRY